MGRWFSNAACKQGAAAAITLASVTVAFLGALGAVTAAGTVGTVLNVVDDVLSGKPLIEVYNLP